MSTKKNKRNNKRNKKKSFRKNPVIWLVPIVIAVSVIFALQPDKRENDKQEDSYQYKTTNLSIRKSMSENTVSFNVDIADTPELTSYGLMNREYMPEDNGMLFVFPYPDKRSFWMKNTIISLDIIFISGDGKIVQISENTTPFSTESIVCLKPAQYVLEVNAGIAEKFNIEIGDEVIWESY